ncbi:hypothetical protein V1336_001900 [Vibrio alginolyticus]|nr:hypothetical protein [Vibrio alginolyticus]
MAQLLSFKENSKKITQHFLQSVVAVDDHIRFESRPTEIDELIEPEESDFGTFDASAQQAGAPLSHELYYQDLSHSFASKGVVCGGFSPQESDLDSSLEAVVNTSKNSDITILDWQMKIAGADGEFATNTIIELSNNDADEGGRTRLICIYTAEDTGAVANTLKQSLTHLTPSLKNTTMMFGSPNFTHWKIEVVNKGDIQEADLCDFLIDSFTELTAGLLSNATLSSIASIRDNTHNLLHKFNKELDTAYLSHVLGLISSPDMREQANEVAFDYAVDLISEELKSELQTSQIVKNSLSEDVLMSWPRSMSRRPKAKRFRIKMGEDKVEFNHLTMEKLISASKEEDLIAVLEGDLGIEGNDKASVIDIFNKALIQLNFDKYDTKPLLDLCSLESTRRDIVNLKEHIPALKQGTLIQNNGKYYICIQPVCDTVRLAGGQSFTFIEASISSSDFTHVMKSRQGHLKLKIKPSAKKIKTINFTANVETKTILSDINENGVPCFYGTLNEGQVTFEWCGEFKFAISQAIVNGLASQLARVGLDSFEWLRQKQK